MAYDELGLTVIGLRSREGARRAPLPRLRHDVDHRWLTALDDRDSPVERWAELIWLANRAEACDAQGARHGGEIRCRVFDLHPDALILHWALPTQRYAFLMLLVVIVRAVIKDNYQQWDTVTCRRPKGVGSHQEVAVA